MADSPKEPKVILTYRVVCSIDDGPQHPRTVTVGDTSNHRTSFADIPRIIAVSTVGAANVDRIRIHEATLKDEEVIT